jgi:hypothetical protein
MRKRELDAKIRELCEAKGLKFKPWEIHPADVGDGPSPYSASSAGGASWPKAQKLRRQLIAEIEADAAKADKGRSA